VRLTGEIWWNRKKSVYRQGKSDGTERNPFIDRGNPGETGEIRRNRKKSFYRQGKSDGNRGNPKERKEIPPPVGGPADLFGEIRISPKKSGFL